MPRPVYARTSSFGRRHRLPCNVSNLLAVIGSLACWLNLPPLLAAEPTLPSAAEAAQRHESALPHEPVAIGHAPQFLFDNYIVDNHWALRSKREFIVRVLHQPQRHAKNPVFRHDNAGHPCVVYDPVAEKFHLYYQANRPTDKAATADGPDYQAHTAYAESKDGVNWTRPHLNLFPHLKFNPNNVVLARADIPAWHTSAAAVFEPAEKDHRGYRYLMTYRGKGPGGGEYNSIRVVGSHDGVHWDLDNDASIAHLHSDTANSVCYDDRQDEYVMFCRAKHVYRATSGPLLETGASRRIARLASRDLWTDWMADRQPQNILTPDELDAENNFRYFYGMPTNYHAGIYWGFLQPFELNDHVHTELAWSRDGVHFERLPQRPKLMEYGEDGAWDDNMIFVSPRWVERRDEWWLYYGGWDGPHGTSERTGAIGLATLRKEGFISLRGPAGGGVVCTRRIIWPGGDLLLNVDAKSLGGDVQVRVSDERRKVIAGFDYSDGTPFQGDAVRHAYRWGNRSLDELKGQPIRLEIQIRNADLYTFQAAIIETQELSP